MSVALRSQRPTRSFLNYASVLRTDLSEYLKLSTHSTPGLQYIAKPLLGDERNVPASEHGENIVCRRKLTR